MIIFEYSKRKEVVKITIPYYEKRALIARSLSHPLRVQLAHILAQRGELCVWELTEEVEASQSSVSKHLAILKDVGVVECRRDGLKVYYQIRTPCILQFFECLDAILKEDIKVKMCQFHDCKEIGDIDGN